MHKFTVYYSAASDGEWQVVLSSQLWAPRSQQIACNNQERKPIFSKLKITEGNLLLHWNVFDLWIPCMIRHYLWKLHLFVMQNWKWDQSFKQTYKMKIKLKLDKTPLSTRKTLWRATGILVNHMDHNFLVCFLSLPSLSWLYRLTSGAVNNSRKNIA